MRGEGGLTLTYLSVSSGVRWCLVVARSPCCDARSDRVAVTVVCCYVVMMRVLVPSGRCGRNGVLEVFMAVATAIKTSSTPLLHCTVYVYGTLIASYKSNTQHTVEFQSYKLMECHECSTGVILIL